MRDYSGILTRIFRNLDLGIEWVLRCKAMELQSLRCTVSRLERVVVVRPTYTLFSLETQSSKGYLNICTRGWIFTYIYIYIYMCVCVCVCVNIQPLRTSRK